MRMSHDPEAAIKVLQTGLAPGRPHSFAQADALVSIGAKSLTDYSDNIGLVS